MVIMVSGHILAAGAETPGCGGGLSPDFPDLADSVAAKGFVKGLPDQLCYGNATLVRQLSQALHLFLV